MKILLVDDEPSVVEALLPALQAAPGLEVHAATTGQEALDLAASFGSLDCLITDVVMEPMNGFELRDRLAEAFPSLKTIFISGYDLEAYGARISGSKVLQKPFEPGELVACLGRKNRSDRSDGALSGNPPGAPRDLLPGTTLAGYQIISKLGDGNLGPVYHAIQIAVQRPVALKVLSRELQASELARHQFLLNVRTKANVQHPNLIAVYEAMEAEGYCFYAREFVDGETLSEIQQRNAQLDLESVLKVIRLVSKAMIYLHHHKIPHRMLSARSIFIGADHQVHLTNLATPEASYPEPQKEIVAFAKILIPLLEEGRARPPGFNAFFARMTASNANGFLSWAALLQALESVESKFESIAPGKLSAKNAAALRAVERSKLRKKVLLCLGMIALFAGLPLAGFVAYFNFDPATKGPGIQCEIPAGEFVFGDGTRKTLGTFWIDKHEVTIGQYAEFLEWIKANPESVGQFEHVDQPKGRSHVPLNWDDIYERAKWGLNYKSHPLGFDCPQFSVSYWDAYAYAKWKGRRLPTEEEWEKAARGTDGRVYPWGNQWIQTKCNAAQATKEGVAGTKPEGFVAPVNAFPSDVSPYGVVGMAGNLREWTDSWDPKTRNPVVKGSSYDHAEHELNLRYDLLGPQTRSETVGFRTCSSEK